MAKKKKKTSKKAPAKKKSTKNKKTKKTTKKKSGGKKKPGLYANIHKAQERQKKGGRKVRTKGAKGAPSNSDFAKAAKTEKAKS